jgi:hypothetical protein
MFSFTATPGVFCDAVSPVTSEQYTVSNNEEEPRYENSMKVIKKQR